MSVLLPVIAAGVLLAVIIVLIRLVGRNGVEGPDRSAAQARGGGRQASVEEVDGMAHPRPAYIDREARRELLLLDERLHRRFFEEADMSPSEWAEIADRVVFVHDRMAPELVVERFERATETTVTAPEETELSPRQIFARLNEQLEPGDRLQVLRTMQKPVPADVYGPPE
jgi:hypothetical protein